MKTTMRNLFVLGVACALLFAQSAQAGTIIKLSLGDDPTPDVEFDGAIFSTIDNGDGATPGEQNTAVEFLDFLSSHPPIPTAIASYTVSGVTAVTPATVLFGSLVIAEFTGGSFALYDDLGGLLLSADLDDSALSGPLGPPATGALFTTTFATVTGGSLAPLIDPNTISLSISMTDINGGLGFSTSSGLGGDFLDPFEADVTENIAAEQIPEPATAVLAMLALAGAGICRGHF